MTAISFPWLWIPRQRRIVADVLEMAHLRKGSNGHLLKNSSGHLVNFCCAATLDVTVAGNAIDSGVCDNGYPFSWGAQVSIPVNGTYTLTNIGDTAPDCGYSGSFSKTAILSAGSGCCAAVSTGSQTANLTFNVGWNNSTGALTVEMFFGARALFVNITPSGGISPGANVISQNANAKYGCPTATTSYGGTISFTVG